MNLFPSKLARYTSPRRVHIPRSIPPYIFQDMIPILASSDLDHLVLVARIYIYIYGEGTSLSLRGEGEKREQL